MFDRIQDTIVAVSSPPGIGPRGIVRVSGPQAIELCAAVFRCDDGSSLEEVGGHQRRPGALLFEDDASVPTEAYIFRAPSSYTRQDLVELHTVGSPPVLAMAHDALVARGARPAEPGEFTGRAFLLGAMDLTRVEGVAAIIHAQSDAQLRASEMLLHGSLGRQTRVIRDELADLLASIEAEIDFAEEPIEFVAPGQVVQTIGRIAAHIDDLLAHSGSTERLEVLPRFVLAGLPNAGKSTLFNRLTGLDRAIRSAIAGTTRDVIAAPLSLPGGEVILCDTAGVTEISQANTVDEALATLDADIQQATTRALTAADAILLVVDAADEPARAIASMSSHLQGRRVGLILNKMDRLSGSPTAVDMNAPAISGLVLLGCVSAEKGHGIDELRLRLAEFAAGSADMQAAASQGAALLSLSNRQHGALHQTLDALRRASDLSSAPGGSHAHAELIAVEIRDALHALGLLLGEVTSEDILSRIFSRFCIGK